MLRFVRVLTTNGREVTINLDSINAIEELTNGCWIVYCNRFDCELSDEYAPRLQKAIADAYCEDSQFNRNLLKRIEEVGMKMH